MSVKYRIVFNIRSENNKLPSEKIIIACVNQLWKNSKRLGTEAIEHLRKAIRPMGQLSSGLFLNLDEFNLDNEKQWFELFKVKNTRFLLNEYEFTKIADNFVRVKFWTEGRLIIS